jgi:hypothetical protein
MNCQNEYLQPEKVCISTHTLDSCCPTGEICGKYFMLIIIQNIYYKTNKINVGEDKIIKLEKCYLNNKEYHLGQIMVSEEEKCFNCICSKNFDNSTIKDNEFCAEKSCNTVLRHNELLQRGCIPIYYGEKECCPIDWRCRKYTSNCMMSSGNYTAICQRNQFLWPY